jgi:hypothetical protein
VIAAIAWSVGIAVLSYLWAIRLYNRRRAVVPKRWDGPRLTCHA